MQYVYFCDHCRKFEVHDVIDGEFKCTNCDVVMNSLRISVDEWNELPSEEMLAVIEKSKKNDATILRNPFLEMEDDENQDYLKHDNDLIQDEDLTFFDDYEDDEESILGSTHNGERSIPWMIVAFVSIALSIAAFFANNLTQGIIVSGIAFVSAIASLIKKARLRAFSIIAIVLSAFMIIVWGIDLFPIGGNKPDQRVISGNMEFTIPGYYELSDSSDESMIVYSTGDNEQGAFLNFIYIDAYSADSELAAMMSLANSYLNANQEKINEIENMLLEESMKAGIEGMRQNKSFFVSSSIQQIQDCTIDSLHAKKYEFSGEFEGIKVKGYVVGAFDIDSGELYVVMVGASENSQKIDYLADFDKVIASASRGVGNNGSEGDVKYYSENDSQITNTSAVEQNASVDEVDPELKAALDKYEEFIDEYVVFMKKYQSDPNNAISMLAEYSEMLTQMSQYAEKIDAYDQKKDEMSPEDLKYFIEVTTRIEKKLLDVL